MNNLNMKKIGGIIFSLGVLAIVLDFVNYVPRLLFWIYFWGDGVAWIIKILLVIGGAALYLYGKKQEDEEEAREIHSVD